MKVGPYTTIRHLGSGGMGTVNLATDERSGRDVALKQVPDHPDAESQAKLAMERRGARLLQSFCRISRRVPEYFESGMADGCFYIAMEYIDGQNLAQLIPAGGLPIERAIEIAEELCGFLEDADNFQVVDNGEHRRSLVHGDLTPRNIRINAQGEVKVLDFGIAKGLLGGKTENTWGSFEYMPPERLGEAPDGMLDASTDRWAVGVVLHEMLDGRRPFRGRSQIELQRLMSLGPPPLRPECPVALRAIVAKLLACDPAARYASARAIRDDLAACRAGATTLAAREGWPRAADDEATRRTVRPPDLPTARTTPGTPVIPPIPPIPVIPAIPATAVAAGEPSTTRTPRAGATAARRRWPRLPWGVRRPRRPWSLRRPRLSWKLAGAALLAYMLLLVGNEIVVARDAATAAGQASRQTLAELTRSWGEYEQLADRSFLGFGTAGLRRTLTRRTRTAADAVFAAYRGGGTVVMESRWNLTRQAVSSALASTPDDLVLRAALRYCDGHLHRIDGEARRREQQEAAAQQEFAAAVTDFRAAAELQPAWADPFVGLFRTFAIGLADVDSAVDALNRADQLGYTPLERDTAQLAHAYDARGRSEAAAARRATPDRAIELLNRAAQAYRESAALYDSIPDFGSARREAEWSRQRLAAVEARLYELSVVAAPEVPAWP